VPGPATMFRPLARGLARVAAVVTLCALTAGLGTLGAPRAGASDAKALLLAAIANTKGSYLVYNFGGQFAAPFQSADGRQYTLNNGGHLLTIKNASARLRPRLLVDTHQGFQARCERDPRARTGEGLLQAAETYAPLQAWQLLGKPTIAVNANFFDVRPQRGGSWRETGCSSPLGAYVDNTRGLGRANAAVTGTIAYAGKQGLSGGDERWTALATMILPAGGAPYVVMPKGPQDYDAASPVVTRLVESGARFVAVAGLGLLAPGDTDQLNDPGPSAARTAIGYNSAADQLYVFQGGSYTPDQMQDLYRALGADHAILLDGGGSSAIVLRRYGGGMWSGAGAPRGSCDTREVLCDSRERALPSWLAFD